MSFFSKSVLFILAVFVGFLMVRHARTAMQASVPSDMPADARFVQSGYDISQNEAKGEWIACRAELNVGDDWCRVTDAHGAVVYQGSFVPTTDVDAVPDNQLEIAAVRDDQLWVQGPAEQGPVPVIPLSNGKLLVPAADRDALLDRWARNPDELRQIQGR